MKMFDIEDKQVTVDVKQSTYPVKFTHRSNIQKLVAEVVSDIFPRDVILEDFIVPGSQKSVDFFIPRRSIVIEVQGRQHDEFVPFFHGKQETSNKFVKQKLADAQKRHWTEINGFTLIEISHRDEETYDSIRNIIRSKIG